MIILTKKDKDLKIPVGLSPNYEKQSSSPSEIKLQEKSISITENSQYDVAPDKDYDGLSNVHINVNVPSKEPKLQEKSTEITSNGKYIVTPDSQYDGISRNNIAVNIPEKEIKLQDKTLNIVENGISTLNHDSGFDGLGTVTIDAEINPNLQEKSIDKSELTNDSSHGVNLEITPDQDYDGLSKVSLKKINLQDKSYTISQKAYSTPAKVALNAGYDAFSSVNVLLNVQSKTLDPSTNLQQVEADTGYCALSKVKLTPVTHEIDSNIKPDNIKKGITILDVEGSYETATQEIHYQYSGDQNSVDSFDKETYTYTIAPDAVFSVKGTGEISNNSYRFWLGYFDSESKGLLSNLKAFAIYVNKNYDTPYFFTDDPMNNSNIIHPQTATEYGEYVYYTQDSAITNTSLEFYFYFNEHKIPDFAFYSMLDQSVSNNDNIQSITLTKNVVSTGTMAFAQRMMYPKSYTTSLNDGYYPRVQLFSNTPNEILLDGPLYFFFANVKGSVRIKDTTSFILDLQGEQSYAINLNINTLNLSDVAEGYLFKILKRQESSGITIIPNLSFNAKYSYVVADGYTYYNYTVPLLDAVTNNTYVLCKSECNIKLKYDNTFYDGKCSNGWLRYVDHLMYNSCIDNSDSYIQFSSEFKPKYISVCVPDVDEFWPEFKFTGTAYSPSQIHIDYDISSSDKTKFLNSLRSFFGVNVNPIYDLDTIGSYRNMSYPTGKTLTPYQDNDYYYVIPLSSGYVYIS